METYCVGFMWLLYFNMLIRNLSFNDVINTFVKLTVILASEIL